MVGGRMMARRGHGKTTFCHIKDRTGQIQVYIRKDEIGEENYNIMEQIKRIQSYKGVQARMPFEITIQ